MNITVSELLGRLNLIVSHELWINYYYCSPSGAGYDRFAHKFFPDSFKYDPQSLNVCCRWKNYNNEKVIIVNVDSVVHLKIFLWDLIKNEIFPFRIIILSSKPDYLLEKVEFFEMKKLDKFIVNNVFEKPDVFFRKYVGHKNYEYFESDDDIVSVRVKRTRQIVAIFRMSEIRRYASYYKIDFVIL